MTAAAQRLGALDSLRLIAAGLVFVQHVAEGQGNVVDRWLIPFEPGIAGVALFFFISGYAMALSHPKPPVPAPFLARRLLRIYPLYLAVLAMLAVLGPAGVLPKWAFLADAGPGQWLANLLLVQDFVGQRAILGVSWTLILELGFYALFAFGLLRWGDAGADRLLLLAAAAIIGLALVSIVIGSRVPLGRPLMIAAALLGWQRQRQDSGQLDAAGFRRRLALFLLVALVATGIGFGLFHHARLQLVAVVVPWLAAVALFLAGLGPARRWPWLARGWVPRAGAASYAVYLLHPLAIEAAARYLPDVRLAAAVLVTALAAAAGHRLIERPGMALGRRLARPLAVPI